MKITNRVEKLRERFAEKEIDAILISQPENRYYLSGFNGSAGYLLITPKHTILATDFRYIEQAKEQAPDYQIFQISGRVEEWFPRLITDLSITLLGFEAENITFAQYREFSEVLHHVQTPFRLVPVGSIVESIRAVKEPEEIQFITHAVEISDRAIEYISDKIQPGMTEMALAWEIEKFMRENGSQPLPFDVIFASGPNSALPHHKPDQRQVNAGEPIVIDIGARVGGYASDLTRTLCLGTPDKTFKKVYDTVLGAQLAAINLIKDGITGEKADSFARTVIEEAGYGKYFGHSLGHGVGLAEHEQPRLGPRSTDTLSSSMVFTIEPGIYLPGWGGVRIEDTAILEGGKVKLLSRAPKINV